MVCPRRSGRSRPAAVMRARRSCFPKTRVSPGQRRSATAARSGPFDAWTAGDVEKVEPSPADFRAPYRLAKDGSTAERPCRARRGESTGQGGVTGTRPQRKRGETFDLEKGEEIHQATGDLTKVHRVVPIRRMTGPAHARQRASSHLELTPDQRETDPVDPMVAGFDVVNSSHRAPTMTTAKPTEIHTAPPVTNHLWQKPTLRIAQTRDGSHTLHVRIDVNLYLKLGLWYDLVMSRDRFRHV